MIPCQGKIRADRGAYLGGARRFGQWGRRASARRPWIAGSPFKFFVVTILPKPACSGLKIARVIEVDDQPRLLRTPSQAFLSKLA